MGTGRVVLEVLEVVVELVVVVVRTVLDVDVVVFGAAIVVVVAVAVVAVEIGGDVTVRLSATVIARAWGSWRAPPHAVAEMSAATAAAPTLDVRVNPRRRAPFRCSAGMASIIASFIGIEQPRLDRRGRSTAVGDAGRDADTAIAGACQEE